jgi:hypothetical protein
MGQSVDGCDERFFFIFLLYSVREPLSCVGRARSVMDGDGFKLTMPGLE